MDNTVIYEVKIDNIYRYVYDYPICKVLLPHAYFFVLIETKDDLK